MRLVLDWDGTVTERDTLDLVLREFGDPGVYRQVEHELGRTLSLHEVIALEFETVTAPVDEVGAWLAAHVRVRPGFGELVARRAPLVVSAGFHELIEPVLRREGVEVELLANRVEASSAGWKAVFRDTAPCPVCGEPCKRAALRAGEPFAYAGDGYSDRCVALAAERVFATGSLATYLEGRGAPFEPLTDFHDLDARLT
ncbi:MAG TPA: haloacid dehalogenase-like hydrolase [Gaiellaceae bacterium]|nr:haloacid dehalogenase-like hydrolase [Gaiellaceae bacterium]